MSAPRTKGETILIVAAVSSPILSAAALFIALSKDGEIAAVNLAERLRTIECHLHMEACK